MLEQWAVTNAIKLKYLRQIIVIKSESKANSVFLFPYEGLVGKNKSYAPFNLIIEYIIYTTLIIYSFI